jgi:hypothetical protein
MTERTGMMTASSFPDLRQGIVANVVSAYSPPSGPDQSL